MALSDYEKEKMRREDQKEADFRRSQREGQTPDNQSDVFADEQAAEEGQQAQEQPQQRKESRYESAMNRLKQEGRQRLWQKGKEGLKKKFGKKGVEEVGKQVGKQVVKQAGKQVVKAGVQAGVDIGAGALGGGAVGGTAIGGTAIGGAAVGGTAVGGTAVAGVGGTAAVGLFATPVGWIILIIVAILLIVFLLILLVLIMPAAMCQKAGSAAAGASAMGEVLGILPKDFCLEFAKMQGYAEGSKPTNYQQCSPETLQTIAQEQQVPYPNPQNDPALLALMTCVGNRVSQAKVNNLSAAAGSYTAAGGFPVYTFDNTYPNCNFTRGTKDENGATYCSSSCPHSPNSCHYGGSKYNSSGGKNGSLAVDYSTANPAIAQQIVNAANQCGAKQNGSIPGARCEDSGSNPVACTSSTNFTHVHINAAACDRN